MFPVHQSQYFSFALRSGGFSIDQGPRCWRDKSGCGFKYEDVIAARPRRGKVTLIALLADRGYEEKHLIVRDVTKQEDEWEETSLVRLHRDKKDKYEDAIEARLWGKALDS